MQLMAVRGHLGNDLNSPPAAIQLGAGGEVAAGRLASFYHPGLFSYQDSSLTCIGSAAGSAGSAKSQAPTTVAACFESSNSSPCQRLQDQDDKAAQDNNVGKLNSSVRMACPILPASFVGIGRACLSEDPLMRPSFEQVAVAIEGMMATEDSSTSHGGSIP